MDNDKLHNLCYTWLVKSIINLTLIIVSAIIIVIVNSLLNYVLLKLGKYERLHRITNYLKSLDLNLLHLKLSLLLTEFL